MAVKKRGLGKGLDSLIPNKVPPRAAGQTPEKPAPKKEGAAKQEESGERIASLPISKVEPNRSQPRKRFDEAAISELAESIKEHGIITPILVQKEKGYYQIIAGERRWRAARKAGLKEIPAIVKNYEGAERLAISLIENIQREDLDVLEDSDWIENDEGGMVTYAEAIYDSIIAYYDSWLSGNTDENLVGINSLELGEIRHDDEGYYALSRVTYADKDGGSYDVLQTCYLTVNGNSMFIEKISEEESINE